MKCVHENVIYTTISVGINEWKNEWMKKSNKIYEWISKVVCWKPLKPNLLKI